MTITFYFKPTKKGFRAISDIMEMSIHKGINAWGKTQEDAMTNLCKKWNKKVNTDFIKDTLNTKSQVSEIKKITFTAAY